jgi:hypothetical protein
MTVQNSFAGYMFSGYTLAVSGILYPDDGNRIDTEFGGISLITNLGDGSTVLELRL